jgi:transcriptional regulator with XRE-family HTH domain
MNNLKKIREAKNITQKELAESVGVTVLTIHNWESGAHEIKREKLMKVCGVLQSSREEVLGLFDSGKQTVNIIGNLPMPAPIPANRNFTIAEPLVIISYETNLFGFIQQSADMNRRCLPGQIVLASLNEKTPEEAHGKFVIAELDKKIIFRKFELPNRFIPDSNDTGFDVITPDKFKILGTVLGVQHVFPK